MSDIEILSLVFGASEVDVADCLQYTSHKHNISIGEVIRIILRHGIQWMEMLPLEVVQEIMLRMDWQTLKVFCKMSRRIHSICQSSQFWKEKTKYGGHSPTKSGTI